MNIFKRVTSLEKCVANLLIENGKMNFQLNNTPKFKVKSKYPQGVCVSVNVLSRDEGIFIYYYEYRFLFKGMISIIEDECGCTYRCI